MIARGYRRVAAVLSRFAWPITGALIAEGPADARRHGPNTYG
jgi:hypothetical protein